jgi:hypothetical protein
MGSHGQVLAELVKRGADMMAEMPMANSPDMDRDDMMQMQQQQWNDMLTQLPKWGIVMVVITMAVFYLLIVSVRDVCLGSDSQSPQIPQGDKHFKCASCPKVNTPSQASYTIGRVVMTLAMIETPTVDYVPVASLDNLDSSSKDSPTLLIDGEAHSVIHNKPITGKIRRTIRHLHSHAGFFARWRGAGYALLYNALHGSLYFALYNVIKFLPLARLIAATLSAVALSQLHCAWTHKMITLPEPRKSLLQRIPPRHTWRQLWIPNVVAAATSQAAVQFFVLTTMLLGATAFDHEKQALRDGYAIIALKLVALAGLAFFLAFFIVLPTYAALTRIEATLLPDDEDTIVPFDRTFGGKVTPVVVGGSGFAYVREVCRTFDREARVRIIKLFFKLVAICLALLIVYVHVISFELFFIIGPIAKDAARQAAARVSRMM